MKNTIDPIIILSVIFAHVSCQHVMVNQYIAITHLPFTEKTVINLSFESCIFYI